MTNKAANAMTAKTKAIYAKRLKESDYQNLLQKKSVAEIASYLKNDTYFKESLDGINEKALHRGQLEVIIRNDLIKRISRILKYSPLKNGGFFRIVVIQSEINLLLASIRSILSGDYQKVIIELPLIIESEICFDIKKVANCRELSELAEIVKGTPYYDIIYKYRHTEISEFNFVGLEQELQRHYYEEMGKLVKTSISKSSKDAIEEIFYTEVELDNISKIYRLKKYFNAPKEMIKDMITPVYSRFTKRDLEDIIDNVSADHIIDRLCETSYRNYLDDSRFMFIEHTTKMINYNLNHKHLLFSSDADLVLLTYLSLMGIEIQNIVDIIEGVRYHIPAEQIKKMLIY